MRITIHIATKDRPNELFGLLQSLRTQTIQDFDLIILDDASQQPIFNYYLIDAIINRMKLEVHLFKLIRNDISYGVCKARNKLIDEDDFNNDLILRLDDDVILNKDYINELIKVIKKGYDMASGVVPLLGMPEIIRQVKYIKPIINEHKLDKEGNLIQINDDCGYCYDKKIILPTHHFRTNFMYKPNDIRYPTNLSNVGFREEGFFSINAIIKGYKLGINIGAVAYHLRSPFGGVRDMNYPIKVQSDDMIFREWIKKLFIKHGNFFEKYNKEVIK